MVKASDLPARPTIEYAVGELMKHYGAERVYQEVGRQRFIDRRVCRHCTVPAGLHLRAEVDMDLGQRGGVRFVNALDHEFDPEED